MFIINEGELGAKAQQVIVKTWGKEFVLVNNDKYCCKLLKVMPGFQASIHCHTKKDETFIGVTGNCVLTLHKENKELDKVHSIHPGMSVRISPKTFHSFMSMNEAWIMEVSTPHSDKDVTRIQESRKIEK